MGARGYLCLVLHAHLPFVRHPEHEEFLEEDWLFEALTETYLPLVHAFERLLEEGIRFRVTMSVSPTLLSMLGDDLLRARYRRHLDELCELADREVHRTTGTPEHEAACLYRHLFHQFRETYVRIGGDVPGALRRFRDAGALEIVASAATHAFLPLLAAAPAAVRAQIRTGVRTHRRFFGAPPSGLWLPECGWSAGQDALLAAEGIRYTFLDAHGLLFARPRPAFGVHAPIKTPGGLHAIGRDMESSRQVWSSVEGYPGDAEYREFYRDLGYDAEHEYIRPYLSDPSSRKAVGIKYHRVTGRVPLGEKATYVPAAAAARAEEHAAHFVWSRERQSERLFAIFRGLRPPLVVAPYDAELFGHWWFEGPLFLQHVLRKAAASTTVETITPSEYLSRHPESQPCEPSFSSWGNRGYAEVWLNSSNDWIYPLLHRASDRMTALSAREPNASGSLRRALDQAAREVLLAQASDWAFMMAAGTTVEYAKRRTTDHLARFDLIRGWIEAGRIDEAQLSDIESKDNIFPDVDYRDFAPMR